MKQIYRNFNHGKTPPQSVLCQWEDIVTRFSKLQLSYESDRLPALSGFAKQLQVADVNVGSYLAGLWSVCLPGLMLWIRSPSSPIRPRPSIYVAPSRSWAVHQWPCHVPALLNGSWPLRGAGFGRAVYACWIRSRRHRLNRVCESCRFFITRLPVSQ